MKTTNPKIHTQQMHQTSFPHAGILVEGLGSLLDGLMGTGNGTTSTSINVGVVGLTKVGSRRVIQVQATFMIVFGLLTKFGAIFVTIPDPVIGASFFILFGKYWAIVDGVGVIKFGGIKLYLE